MYYSTSSILFPEDISSIGAHLYFYQDENKLFIGSNNSRATFDKEGIHMTLGTTLPKNGEFSI